MVHIVKSYFSGSIYLETHSHAPRGPHILRKMLIYLLLKSIDLLGGTTCYFGNCSRMLIMELHMLVVIFSLTGNGYLGKSS